MDSDHRPPAYQFCQFQFGYNGAVGCDIERSGGDNRVDSHIDSRMELHKTAVHCRRTVCVARRSGIYRTSCVRDGSVAVNVEHIQGVVPNARRSDIYADYERVVSEDIYFDGRKFHRKSIVFIKNLEMRSYKYMKRKNFIILLSVIIVIAVMFTVKTYALTESEVNAQVAASSKEAVGGNVFIWFLCAIAFMKISQKIEGIMNNLGINVTKMGGSMLGEIMIAMRGMSMMKNFFGGGKSGAGGTNNNSTGNGGNSGFSPWGFSGTVGRRNSNTPQNSSSNNSGTGSSGGLPTGTANQAAGNIGNTPLGLSAPQNVNNISNNTTESNPADTSNQDSGMPNVIPISSDGTITDNQSGISPAENIIQNGNALNGISPASQNVSNINGVSDEISQDGVPNQANDGLPIGDSQVGTMSDTNVVSTEKIFEVSGDNAIANIPMNSTENMPPSDTIGAKTSYTNINSISSENSAANNIPVSDTINNNYDTNAVNTGNTDKISESFNRSTNGSISVVDAGNIPAETNDTSGSNTINTEKIFETSAENGSGVTPIPTPGDVPSISINSNSGNVEKGFDPPDSNGSSSISIPSSEVILCDTPYAGYIDKPDAHNFTDIEIGNSVITGTETPSDTPVGKNFSMYDANEYTAPNGKYTTVADAGSSKWYKQYANNNGKMTPYKNQNSGMGNNIDTARKLPGSPGKDVTDNAIRRKK